MPSLANLALVAATCWVSLSQANTNYDKQALSVLYEENPGLPSFGTLNGTVTELDTISPNIILNRTDATLNCSSGFMHINLKFKQPFYGIVYADFDRNSACKIAGNGKESEVIKLPLKGCGTVQSPARVFTNNIVVRFHPGLEIDGDEVITVVCRYPPPIVPPPLIPESLQLPAAEVPRLIQPLGEFEILLIICAIIFMALLLLGMGCSYYCLKKRNIKVVRRRPPSSIPSDVTKISEPNSMVDGLKIPRAHAVDASGSEQVTESIRTDFPSDIASLESEEEYTSAYSDKMCILAEGHVVNALSEPPMPNFDINMIVKYGQKAITPVPSVTSSSESETVLNAQEQYLTTILERTETNTLETLERVRKAKAQAGPPPVHARLNIKNKQLSDTSDIDTQSEYSRDGTEFSEQEMELEARQMRNYSLAEGQFSSMMEEEHEGGYRSNEVYESSTSRDLIRPVIRQHIGGASAASASTSFAASGRQSNFDVLIRIVNNDSYSEMHMADDASSIFTEEERLAIKRVLEEDVSVQTQLKKTYTREGFYVLQRNEIIQETVEPQKWDVLVRILNNNPSQAAFTDRDTSSRSSVSMSRDVQELEASGLVTSTMEVRSHAAASSQHQTMETLSAADRSGTEITEYHHYTSNQTFHWEE